MTPLERAARALYEREPLPRIGDGLTTATPFHELDEQARQAFIGDARAVIAAIREPSEAMIDAYSNGIDRRAVLSPDAYWLREDGYTAMISAMLEEGQ